MNEPAAPLTTEEITRAKTDRRSLNALITRYMPFIKKCAASSVFRGQARRDSLTLAMLAFSRGVQTYRNENGAFIPYAAAVIRSRLIDAARKEQSLQKMFAPLAPAPDETEPQWELEAAQRHFDLAEERNNLRLEVSEINAEFAAWGFSCMKLAKNCPKQERSRRSCRIIAKKALEDKAMVDEIKRTRQIPVKKLSALTGITEKTFEKYRRYIAALILIMSGDYPYLHSFLPDFFDTGADSLTSALGAMAVVFSEALP
jgi:RNA polymerase sigma factor